MLERLEFPHFAETVLGRPPAIKIRIPFPPHPKTIMPGPIPPAPSAPSAEAPSFARGPSDTTASPPVPDRHPTALAHAKRGAKWKDAVRPKMRIKIRRWLQCQRKIRRFFGPNKKWGKAVIDPPPEHSCRPSPVDDGVARRRVIEAAALAGRSLAALDAAMDTDEGPKP